MSTVQDIQQITAWVQSKICAQIRLKKPADEQPAESYDYELVTPRAWPVYMPSTHRRAMDVPAVPCVLVTVTKGDDRPKEWLRRLTVTLTFVVWNPGTHGRDIYLPKGDSFTQSDADSFTPNNDAGWQDLYDFIDRARRAIASAEFITDELRAELENGISFGQTDETDGTASQWPYFSGYVSFTLIGARQTAAQYQSFL